MFWSKKKIFALTNTQKLDNSTLKYPKFSYFKVRWHYINWGILLSLFRKIPKIPKTTPVDGFQHLFEGSMWGSFSCQVQWVGQCTNQLT